MTRSHGPPRYDATRTLFLRLLGLVYLIATVSLWTQIDGLIGSRGILPVSNYLEAVRPHLGGAPMLELPTVLWFSASDGALHALCGGLAVFSLLLIAGLHTVPVILLCWAGYLSLVTAGQDFLSFQWDVLLLETGLLSAILAPITWRPGRTTPPPPDPRIGLWLMRLLLFKLMVLSGLVKLASLDDAWWRLSALDVHYFTQPLPLVTSWYAHRLPETFQHLSVGLIYVIEIALPFLIFGSRELRLAAFWGLVGFQVLIAATGNYGFFNLLTAVLCVSLLDDRALRAAIPWRWRRAMPDTIYIPPATSTRGGLTARIAIAVVISALSLAVAIREVAWTVPRHLASPRAVALLEAADRFVIEPAAGALQAIRPLRSINGYGLFRSMTTRRPEIVLEVAASDDSQWHEYPFRWKPGDPRRRPRLSAPHMPRLDWQMWFAALDPQSAPWLRGLLRGVLDREPAVLGLLGDSTLGGSPTARARLVLYDYRFTTLAERRVSGAWWHRDRVADLTGAMTRDDLTR